MFKIILCRGIQGSGKTTWAKQGVMSSVVRPKYELGFKNKYTRVLNMS